jgi:hypothetical protein
MTFSRTEEFDLSAYCQNLEIPLKNTKSFIYTAFHTHPHAFRYTERPVPVFGVALFRYQKCLFPVHTQTFSGTEQSCI